MKPSNEMLQAPAFLALGGSGRSVLRVLMEEIGAGGGGVVELSMAYFAAAGVSANALSTGTRELVALGFATLTTLSTASRAFAPSDGWRAVVDQAEAERRLGEARAQAKARAAAKRPGRRRRAVVTEASPDVAGQGGRLPEGVRRSRWPAMPWEGGAS